ncbi:hypothetical protein K523DRAFT_247261 [Schizophyllum commune Tattone D]|nr:hypothetical protein K525DRAFT_202663 [Schizophyllum commune Loenen D]KAI5827260.1 hypothetical protein K523DRAFT_247261 [Schizophyllum commune Tattone D]
MLSLKVIGGTCQRLTTAPRISSSLRSSTRTYAVLCPTRSSFVSRHTVRRRSNDQDSSLLRAAGARLLSGTCLRRAALSKLDLEGYQSAISDAVGVHLVNQFNLDFPGPAKLPEGWVSGSGGKLPPELPASEAFAAYGIEQRDPFFHRVYANDTRPPRQSTDSEGDKKDASKPTGPPRIPGNWARFPYFMTYIPPSPYYLMLPQLQMVVNIKYGLKGAVVPQMYDPKHEALVFAMRRWDEGDVEAAAPRYYWLHCPTGEVSEFLLPDMSGAEESLAARWESAEESLTELLSAVSVQEAPQIPLEADAKGLAIIERIMNRDPTVIDVLEKEYFGFKISPTTEEQEAQLFDPRPLQVADELEKRFVEEGVADPAGNPEEARIDINVIKEWMRLYGMPGQEVNIEKVAEDYAGPEEEVAEEPTDRFDEHGRRILEEVEDRRAP